MKLPFKQSIKVQGITLWEGVKHEYAVGERSSVLVFTPEFNMRRVYREYVDLGNGYGAWKKLHFGLGEVVKANGLTVDQLKTLLS